MLTCNPSHCHIAPKQRAAAGPRVPPLASPAQAQAPRMEITPSPGRSPCGPTPGRVGPDPRLAGGPGAAGPAGEPEPGSLLDIPLWHVTTTEYPARQLENASHDD